MCNVVLAGFSDVETTFFKAILQEHFYNAELFGTFATIEPVEAFAEEQKIELLLLRLHPESRAQTFRTKAKILAKHPGMKVILFDEAEDLDAVLTGLRCGAIDYLYAPYEEEMCKQAIHRAILSLNEISLISEEVPESSHNKKAIVNQLLLYIKTHYQEPIQLQSLAQHVHLNEYYISKLFKETLGLSFSKYLRKFRIERAKVALTQTKQSVREVSEGIGIFDSAYFSRIFKEETGMTPMKYREDFAGNRTVSDLTVALMES